MFEAGKTLKCLTNDARIFDKNRKKTILLENLTKPKVRKLDHLNARLELF